jgi:hypothetical protein
VSSDATVEAEGTSFEWRAHSATVFVAPKLPTKSISLDEAIDRLLRKPVDLTAPLARQDLVTRIARLEAAKMEETEAKALALGYPLRTAEGAVLAGFNGDHPLYDIDHNVKAAISTGASLVQASPFNVDGSGFKIGLWEAGDIPRASHQEFDIRMMIAPGQTSSTDSHASHVAGTLMASGVNASVKGMAPGATLLAYDTTGEISEMIANAAALPGQADKLYVSNHSYGYAVGWGLASINGQVKPVWYGTYDSGTPTDSEAYLFGRYGAIARQYDDLSWDAPYYLIFKSSGNDRNDAKPVSGTWYLNADPTQEYNFTVAPPGDADWMTDGTTGFGTIGERGAAKNIVTVGSVTDAVSSTTRDVSVASLSAFSSAGPADDGRIKPDLVANGNSLLSTDHVSDTATIAYSGTSMSSPNVCGSALLLVDYYDSLFPGQSMLASTLKGLLLHTADDLGNEGPDYRFGWGLMNVKEAADLLNDHEDSQTGSRVLEGELDGTNLSDEVTVTHDGSGPLRVSVCWTDPAGDSTSVHNNTARRLVHDLNLTVVGPNQTHLPYVMPWVTSGFDNSKLDDPAATGVNTVDNIEQVFIKQVNAPAGDYTIRIDYANVLAEGSQKYSLIVSGTDFSPPAPEVTVENPVADMSVTGGGTDPILDVADVDTVFSEEAVSYAISVVPGGILTALIQGDGTVDLTPTGTQYGTATVTLTATDAGSNEVQDAFEVTIKSPVLYVDASISAAAPQDGFCWATSFKYLQDALAIAESGQQVWVVEGVYYPDITLAGGDANNRAASFSVPAGVSLYGGFVGNETLVTEAAPKLNITHLSGDIDGANGGVGDDGPLPGSYANGLSSADTNTNSYNVVNLSASGVNDVFTGFTVSGGYASSGTLRGGGVYSLGGSALISHCQISGCYSSQTGAGIYLRGGTPRVLDCLLSGNRAGGNGGGLWADSSDVDVQGCEFRGNDASGAGGFGVAVAFGDASPAEIRAVNCIVSGNRGFFGSGGVQILSGNLSLVHCTINGNRCAGSSGGGVLVTSSTLAVAIKNCIIWNNFAGGNQNLAPTSSVGKVFAPNPIIEHSLVQHCGSSGAGWITSIGTDGGGNLGGDPLFVSFIDPVQDVIPTESGIYLLNESSPALNVGNAGLLPADVLDVDNDGDLLEDLPLDLAGNNRIFGSGVDLGPFEAIDLNFLDTDLDGISDAYEIAHSGTATGLNPFADLDGDGLANVVEFALGLDPSQPLSAPVGAITSALNAGDGQNFLTITYVLDDNAVLRGGGDVTGMVTVAVERRTVLTDSNGWKLGETVEVSAEPVAGQPGMIRIVERSHLPLGYQPTEFLRLRIEVVP